MCAGSRCRGYSNRAKLAVRSCLIRIQKLVLYYIQQQIHSICDTCARVRHSKIHWLLYVFHIASEGACPKRYPLWTNHDASFSGAQVILTPMCLTITPCLLWRPFTSLLIGLSIIFPGSTIMPKWPPRCFV